VTSLICQHVRRGPRLRPLDLDAAGPCKSRPKAGCPPETTIGLALSLKQVLSPMYPKRRRPKLCSVMNQDADRKPGRLTRRQFLGTVGAGAVAAGTRGVLGAEAAHAAPGTRGDRFGRLFPTLPPFADPAAPGLEAALMDIGRPGPGSIMDADDDLSLGPLGLILTPGPVNVDNLTQTAGSTFMGQFMDHDMTFDTASRLGVPTQPHKSPNARTPRFDLDSVYAGGPTVNPHLYEPADPARLIVGSNTGVPPSRSRTCIGTRPPCKLSSPTLGTTRTS